MGGHGGKMTIEKTIMFFVTLFAGTGIFLVGVNLLTDNIEQLATTRIKKLFEKTVDKKHVSDSYLRMRFFALLRMT